MDILASNETAEGDVDIAFISVVECSIEAMTVLHSHSCCTCTTASTSAHNVVSWEQIKTATAEDNKMQDLMQYIMSGFLEDARMLPAHIKPYNPYQSSLYIVV